MKLFRPKTKKQQCEEMIRILKAHGQMPSMVGRNWYHPSTLYSGDGTADDDLIISDSKRSITGKLTNNVIEGPWHLVKPRGPGFKINDDVLQYSAIPIHGTRFAWCRIIKDQLNGTIDYEGLKDKELIELAKTDNAWTEVKEPGTVTNVYDDNSYDVRFKNFRKKLKLIECKVDYFTNRKRLNRKKKRLEVGDDVQGYVQFKIYGRIYWYFVAEFKNGIVHMPSQYYSTDFDSKWCHSPLYDPEMVYGVLDDKLRSFILETNSVDKYLLSAPAPPKMRNLTDSEVRLNLLKYQQQVHKDCTSIMNTTVFHKAELARKGALEKGEMMKLTDYDQTLGFERPGPITKHEFELMANEFKCTTLIVAHNCVEIMKYCKSHIFDDETRTYMGNIKCEDNTYKDLKQLYEYQVDTLKAEIMQWCGKPQNRKAGPEIPIKQETVYEDMYEYMEEQQEEYEMVASQMLYDINELGMPMNAQNALQSIQALVGSLQNGNLTAEDFNSAPIRSQPNVQALIWLMDCGQVPQIPNPLDQEYYVDDEPTTVRDNVAPNWPFNGNTTHAEATVEFTEILQDRALFSSEDSDKNRTIKNSILQALFATLVTHWYRTYYWVVTNPIKKIGEYYTLMPGNGWQMRLIVNIASINTPLPIVSNRFTSWLVDKRLTNRPIHFTTSDTVFGSVNMTESGLMTQDGLGNIINETLLDGMTRYNSTAMQASKFVGWLDNQETQRTLAQYSNNFDNMDELQIDNFMQTDYIKTFSAHLGKAATQLFNSVVEPGLGQGGRSLNLKSTKDAITYNVQHAVLQITKAEINMWLDMYWVWHLFIVGAFSALAIRKLLPEKANRFTDVGSLYLPHILMPLGSQIGNLITNGVRPALIPNLIIESRKNLMLGALYTYTSALCDLVDNTVENDDLVVRYLTPTNRNQWVDWLKNMISLRWKDNFIQRVAGTNAGEHTWFNTENPLEQLPEIVRNVSNTLKRNLHFPPGTCFKIENEYMVVVDDLGSMYTKKSITQEFIDMYGDLKIDIGVTERVKEFLNKLPFLGSKLRLAYNFRTHTVHVVSVAAKNMVQSLKGTLTLMHVALMCGGMKTLDVTAILGAAALEEQQLRLPSLFGAVAGLGGEWLYGQSELETREFLMKFCSATAGMGTYQLMSYFNKYPTVAARSRVFNDRSRDVLVPLVVQLAESSASGTWRKWVGHLWSPITGKKHIFNNTLNRTLDERPVYGYFETDWNATRSELKMTFRGNVQGQGQGTGDFTIEYVYKRSPMLYHIWFVKDN